MRAMILAAGLGTRLGNLTRESPKGMLDIGGKPLLEHIVVNLRQHGFDEIVMNLHFRAEMIQGHFEDGSRWEVSLTWSHEPELLGTAGGVKRMETFLREGEAFLIHYGDILTDQDFQAMLRFHRERKALATVLLHQRAGSNSLVRMDTEGRITCFIERPAKMEYQGSTPDWVNSGVCICDHEFLNHIPAGSPCDLPRDVFSKLAPTGRLYGYVLTGYRCAVDSAARLEEARLAFVSGRFSSGRKSTPPN